MSKNTCAACRFFAPIRAEENGECRFNAPPIISAVDMDGDYMRDVSAEEDWSWPVVAEVQWCGQWKGLEVDE